MTKRVENMWKAINSLEWDKEKHGYILQFDEMLEFYMQDKFEGLKNAFNYGFIKGMRYMKAQQKRKAGGING